MQKEVTEKRSEIDSLNSKIHWLEECMEAAGKVNREGIKDTASSQNITSRNN